MTPGMHDQEPKVTTSERDGCTVKTTWTPGGYSGSTDYEIEGEFDAVSRVVEHFTRQWPAAGYGTWFNWPPGKCKDSAGHPIAYRAPTYLGDGRWIARGHRSNSCD